MKRATLSRRSVSRTLQVVLWATASLLAACDNDVNFSPTAPAWPPVTPVGERSLQISGSLTAERGSCLEATVLFDGVELEGARTVCPDRGGCATLTFAAVTSSGAGRHTISFQVLDQTATTVEYLAQGEALITRDGLGLGGVRIGLGPELATLRPGESVSFEVLFTDFGDTP
jgi:hypothetical protein